MTMTWGLQGPQQQTEQRQAKPEEKSREKQTDNSSGMVSRRQF